MKTCIVSAALAVAGLAWAPAAAPHYLWLERAPARHARLYFGEVQEGVREVSGGRLDEMRGPQIYAVNARGERTSLPTEKRQDYFDAAGARRDVWVIAEETGYEVKDWTQHRMGVVKPLFYARLAPASPAAAPQEPKLTLDMLPVKGTPGTYAVYFRNAPLPKAKVMIYAPNHWMQEHHTDAQGNVRVTTPWRGRYVMEVVHVEQQAGEFEGRPYATMRHRATLTFTAAGAK